VILYNNLCGVNLNAISVGIAAGLDAACNQNLGSFMKISLCKLACTAKSNTADEISSLLVISTVTSRFLFMPRPV